MMMIWVIILAGGFGDGPKANTQYLALFGNILHRMRFPKFLEIVSRELDQEVSIFSLWFDALHGFWSWDKIILLSLFLCFCSVKNFLRACFRMVGLHWCKWLKEPNRREKMASLLWISYYFEFSACILDINIIQKYTGSIV